MDLNRRPLTCRIKQKTWKTVAFKPVRRATIKFVQLLRQRDNAQKLDFKINLNSFLIFFFVNRVQT